MKNFTKTITNKTLFKPTRWLIMALMMLVGTSSAWAANVTYTIYFERPSTWTSGGDIYFGIGKDGWSDLDNKMTHVCGNYYKITITWDGATKIGFTESNLSTWADGNSDGGITGRWNYVSEKKSDLTDKLGTNRLYSVGADGKTLSYTTQTSDPTCVTNYTVKKSEAGGTGTVTLGGTDITTGGVSISSGSKALSITAPTGYNVSTVAVSGGTLTAGTTGSNTYNGTINVTAATTITITYAAKTYIITYKDKGGTTFSGTHANGYPTTHTYGTATTLKAASKAGYTFGGWFTNPACTGSAVTSLGATTYTSNITLYAKWECVQSATAGEGSFSNGTITLSATFNTCGNAYIGFQWKEKNDSWCYDNNADCYVMLGEQNKSNAEVTTTLTKTGGVFVFRPYIVVGNNAQDWLYGDEFEVVTCSDPSAGYSISNENASVDWNGTEKEVIITTTNGYATPSKIYYDGDETKPTAVGEYTITIDIPSHGTYCAATDLEIGTFTITCPTVAAPDITPSATVCAGTPVTLSNYNGVNANTVKWYSSQDCTSEVTQPVTPTNNNKEYYAKAYHEASGCYSSEYLTLTFTVNPLPIISISGNNSAVLYEDVTLTATGSDIDEVNWTITSGPGTLSNTTGTSVKLTSSTAGTVKVKATATSENDCTKESNELSVVFGAENCNDVVEYDNEHVEIWLSSTLNKTMNLHRWYENGDQDTDITKWPGASTTKSDGYYKWITTSSGNIGYIFHDDTNDNKSSDANRTMEKGYRYYFTFNGGTGSATFNKSERITTTTPAPITAPAAKTISVSTTDGEGNIIFSGQVVKTGCDATNEYGFQYSSDEQTWTTVKVGVNAAAGTAISNNTVNGLDGKYYVRAYITNDNSTQYGAVTEITVSTKKYPITRVTLTHVKNQAGEPYSDQEQANLIYCAGETVWFKLEQNGSKFQDFQWISYPGTDLVGMYAAGTFSFTITHSGNVGIRLRNEENVDGEGNPTWVESNLLEFRTHPEPTAPTISFATATICSNDAVGATLTLGATVSDQAYELWKYANDDDTEGSKVANVATLNCTENNQVLQFSGIKTAGKYFVKTYYTAFCNTVIANSTHATLTVVNANDVSISITPATATTTPWMPVKLTISATDDYTLEVPDGVEFSQKGDICSVKIPLPQGAFGGDGQYENVSFPQDATTSYTVTANLVSIGGEDNPCAVPATATVTLTPYVEECTMGH